MGKTRIIAETGAGQHGVATATVCARFGLPCVVYMGAVDIERQKPNVLPHEAARRRGARRSTSGSRTLKDAMNEALRDWVTNVHDTFYMHRHRRRPASLSGDGARFPDRSSAARRARRCWSAKAGCRMRSIACVGGGSNAIGLFHPFLDERGVEIYGVEAAGDGIDMRRARGRDHRRQRPACCTAIAPICCRTTTARSSKAHSISAGLDYPGVGPEHSWLNDMGRVKYLSATDDEALAAFQLCTQARRHHPGARARARARPRARPRAEDAEGSPDGGQSFRPRRQGPQFRCELSERQEAGGS